MDRRQFVVNSAAAAGAAFFASDTLARQMNTQNLTDDELRFLTQLRRYSTNLNESDRKLLLAMVKKFSATATR